MMALSQKMPEQEPSDIEMLLPWHAAGTLNARDARRVEEALARDSELARQYAVIREEYAETIRLNESLGAPSARAMQKLFAAIEAEPAQGAAPRRLAARISDFFASLSPRALAWSAAVAVLALLVQAGVIGAVVMKNQAASYQVASLSMNEPASITRDLGAAAPLRVLVRFSPDARVGDINALLDAYQASIVDARSGLFRLQFADKTMTKEQAAKLLSRLQSEKIVSMAVAAQ
ncbi:hypothetical protein [Bradyrhizobium sp. NP1]|uniref:hypothetical protein n=1 Tax=Bradyrhizobium sp. NP1 TaxID=3049772 RepID=UPI0025A5EE71|nr:hypothetical protein [Bradyrhizobium sp. NP1]WJR80726.1 hypothetical protein QOU61_13490 [Bradyrhizobium sp. NP1]